MMKPSSRWIITVLVCLSITAALAAYKYFQIQAAIAFGKSFPEASESVEAVTASIGSVEHHVTAIGEIVAPQSIQLRNEVEGLIIAINFVAGGRVNKGDVLVQLDISEETARLKAAQARVELARLEQDRLKRLISQKTVSEEAVDRAEANYAIAQAEVMGLEADIAKKTLRAPFDAIAGLHQFDVGEFLQANTAIVTLVGINDFSWVDFNLPWGQADIAVGSAVVVELPGKSAAPLSGEVIARDAAASASSRNIRLRARIDSEESLPPNSIVRLKVPTGSREQIVVPATAILVDAMGDYVYVLTPESEGEGYRAQRRSVTVNYKDDQQAGIAAGLEVGELVVSSGGFKLNQGMLTFVRERPELAE